MDLLYFFSVVILCNNFIICGLHLFWSYCLVCFLQPCSHLLGNSYVFALPFYSPVYMCLVVTCWERAGLLALVCGFLL